MAPEIDQPKWWLGLRDFASAWVGNTLGVLTWCAVAGRLPDGVPLWWALLGAFVVASVTGTLSAPLPRRWRRRATS
ncbi:hypothetical protein ACFYXS_07195 [Streptomyces sp. NPDC002574]|uniref:hypothetical protein n=1 Tax=Streptomyces sp. NPDC002574 TaxID=3364652 RepID=UPI0036BAFAC1